MSLINRLRNKNRQEYGTINAKQIAKKTEARVKVQAHIGSFPES